MLFSETNIPPTRPSNIDHSIVTGGGWGFITTALELPGYRLVRSLGVVRGVTVQIPFGVRHDRRGAPTPVGGNISLFTELCEKTRQEVFDIILVHADQHGEKAVVTMRFEANEVMDEVTEIFAYGTAVVTEEVVAEEIRQ
jgi:uncharacterized protein YbjQ (UPF0145 family)